jgi:DNA-binding response OmpR family regulator
MPWLKGKRILVVEDEVLIAVMVEDMLSDLGTTVIGPAATISDAMALAEAEDIDAAILDVNVRGVRIDPVAEVLRARSIPVLFATGYGEVKLLNGQQATVIDKPYSREKLLHGLEQIFGLSSPADRRQA